MVDYVQTTRPGICDNKLLRDADSLHRDGYFHDIMIEPHLNPVCLLVALHGYRFLLHQYSWSTAV